MAVAREIRRIIIHCSDSADELDIGLAQIELWHSKRFQGIVVGGHVIHCGYHYIVRRDGSVEVGRPEQFVGAHAQGNNHDSIGVCWVGRIGPSQRQHIMLLGLVRNLLLRYGLGPQSVIGHKEVQPAKTCPNLDMDELRAELYATMRI